MKLSNIIQKMMVALLPFFIIGIFIVFFVMGVVILSYVLLYGAVIGFILFLISFIYKRWVACRIKLSDSRVQNPKKGRIIEHDHHEFKNNDR